MDLSRQLLSPPDVLSADNGFAPTWGTVRFAGSGTHTINSLGPNPELVLNTVIFESGHRVRGFRKRTDGTEAAA